VDELGFDLGECLLAFVQGVQPRIGVAAALACLPVNAAVTLAYLPAVNGGSTVQALYEAGDMQARVIAAGDLTQLETLLLTQASALQAMFIDLACRAKNQNQFNGIQTMTSLALKAAAGSRQAIVALAELRMPKSVLFAKQANVTTGPQQVNNGVQPEVHASRGSARAHGENAEISPNELTGSPHELLENARASGRSGSADSRVETLEPVHRAAHR
jgi:hypothetical protein